MIHDTRGNPSAIAASSHAPQSAGASPSEIPTLTITALVRLASDEHGSGPCAGAIRNYVRDGLLDAEQDSTGRYLFRPSDAKRALQIYQARKARHGATGRRLPPVGNI